MNKQEYIDATNKLNEFTNWSRARRLNKNHNEQLKNVFITTQAICSIVLGALSGKINLPEEHEDFKEMVKQRVDLIKFMNNLN